MRCMSHLQVLTATSSNRSKKHLPHHTACAERPRSRDADILCVAVTNNAAQDRIGERGCYWLAVGEQCSFRQNGLEARQTITFARSVDVSSGLPCHIGKDLIEIDSRRGCWCGCKRLKRDARTDTDADGDGD